MADRGNIDPTLRALKPLGRYQILQMLAIISGNLGAAYQLLINIFIGRKVTWQRCAAPDHNSVIATQLQHVNWISSNVTYGECEIIVPKDNHSGDFEQYPCPFGYEYAFNRDLSFRTEFDLVCDWKLLGGLAQTILVAGQGVGAVVASMLSDRYGRKTMLVTSQLGLFTIGLAVAFAPSYTLLVCGKFLLGAFQQGVITSSVTLGMEILPAEKRSLRLVVGGALWSIWLSSMALFAYLFRNLSWRYLQIALSCVSVPLGLFQLWYLDESLRWLVANDKTKAAERMLKRAARVNHKDFDSVLQTLQSIRHAEELKDLGKPIHSGDMNTETKSSGAEDSGANTALRTQDTPVSKKMTILDLFRNKHLLVNSVIMWMTWFTTAFTFFTLYMMSTSLHGNRFLNYFLTALMELVPTALLYFLLDRVGRKLTIRPMYALAGCGLIVSGVCRNFPDSHTPRVISVVAAMLGMVGTSGAFSGIFLFNPELYPTNMRTQALGLSSLAGRLGGMLAPFMLDLADIAVWAPGALIGSLCFLVVGIMHFLPETKGRALPTEASDIDQWYRKDKATTDI